MESKWQNHPAAKVLSKSVAERMISSLNSGQKNIEEIAELHDSTVSDYGEEKIYKTVERTGGEVGKITSTTAQTSYAKFKLLQNKRQVSFYSQSPMTATHAEGTPIIGRGLHQGQNAKFERIKRYLRQRCIQQQAVQKHLQKQMEQNSKRLASVTNMPSALPFQQGRERVWRKLYRAATWLGKNIIKAVIAVARSLTTMLIALGSAGVIVVLSVLFVAIVAVLLVSPLGIIFADQSNDPSAIPIRQIVQETNEEFGQVINDIVEQHPECSEVDIQYIYEEGHTWASYWPEVIAIFAVDANLRGDTDVIVINEGKKDWLKSVFWRMHEIEWWTEQPEGKADDITDHSDDGAAIEIADVLHITVSSLSVKELAEEMNFTDEEKDIMQQLLSDEMRPALLALCGGVAGGQIQWPLPGHSHISCYFGALDAYGNPGHKGIDIPAPQGTPILAAHSGTVLISAWNDSYGNQVFLDDGSGTSTRYAHMMAAAVSPGEVVSAGQVIGYVGSTGDSEGNHLHFEWYQNGIRVDPLTVVSPT